MLTKTQKEILTILRDIPNTEIVNPTYRAAYLERDGGRVKTINSTNFYAINPYLKIKETSGGRAYRYIFDPEATITDDWPVVKRERNQQAREAKQQAERERKDAEIQKALDYLNVSPGPYSVEISDDFTIYIILVDEIVTHSRIAVSSSAFRTFEDYLSDERNVTHFSRLREFINRANRD